MNDFTIWLLPLAQTILAGGLFWATWKLALYTLSLSKLTRALVDIETKRDKRYAIEKRLQELETGLAAANIVQTIDAEIFARQLNNPVESLPTKEMGAIENLQLVKKYFDDQTAHEDIDILCRDFDRARRGEPVKAGMYPYIKTLQDKIPEFVDKIRRERSREPSQ